MIKIGLIGTQSMHAWSFAQVCNTPDGEGNYRFPDVRVVGAYGVDDTPEHIRLTLEKGNIPLEVSSMEELCEHCNAFMVLQRKGGDHLKYASEIIKRGYPVFIDKPVCCTMDDVKALHTLAKEHNVVICGGSGLKHNKQVIDLKEKLRTQESGPLRGATINHSADINSPYDGIFFYLPHAVEMMLTLFGYDPVSVSTTVLSHNNFTVCVKYEKYMINLVLNGSAPCFVVVNGKNSSVTQIDDRDVFVESMRNFVNAIRQQETGDYYKLTRHVAVILAIQESIETNKEAKIGR